MRGDVAGRLFVRKFQHRRRSEQHGGGSVAFVSIEKYADVACRISRAGAEEVGVAGQTAEGGAGRRGRGEPISPRAMVTIFELHIIRGEAASQSGMDRATASLMRPVKAGEELADRRDD